MTSVPCIDGSDDGSDDSSNDGSDDGSDYEATGGINEAALHTLWDVESAKEILSMIAEKPGLTVFTAIRSTWGQGLEIQKAAERHIEGMYDSGYSEPGFGATIFTMLRDTRNLAEKLLQEGEFEAAFFFGHEVAAMIRRCEDDDAQDDPKEVAKALDVLMEGAVKGWRAKNGKGAKKDAATMLKLLEEGKRAEGYDQTKWYPDTLKALKAWAK